jgi:hypothetical protein
MEEKKAQASTKSGCCLFVVVLGFGFWFLVCSLAKLSTVVDYVDYVDYRSKHNRRLARGGTKEGQTAKDLFLQSLSCLASVSRSCA